MHRNSIFNREDGIVYKEHNRKPSGDSKIAFARTQFTIIEGLDKLVDSPRFNGQKTDTTLLEEKQQGDYKPPRMG